jgi:signal transduction histidine kinase
MDAIARRLPPIPPVIIDSALAVVLLGLAEWQLIGKYSLAPLGITAVVLQTLPLAMRRRWPEAVFVLVLIGAVSNLAFGYENSFFGTFGAMLAVYNVAAHGRRIVSWIVLGAAPFALALVLYLDWRNQGKVVLTDIPYNGLLVAAAWILGDNVRSRRAYIAQLEEHDRLIASQREERAQRTVMEERGRIARELHDVVAHSVSVMVLQANAGERVIAQDQQRARASLQAIQQTGREALTELRRLLGVLRVPAGIEDGPERSPQPGVADIEQLVQRVRDVGLPTQLAIEGQSKPLPIGVELSAYRIVQEALTNALRHANATQANVVVRFTDAGLELDVRDNGRTASGGNGQKPTGHGLIGMQERVQLFGGVMQAGPQAEGGYRVTATLPAEMPPSPAPQSEPQ